MKTSNVDSRGWSLRPSQVELCGRALAAGRISAGKVVERRPSWASRALLLGLPPLLLALGLGLLARGPLPLGPLGWALALAALALGGAVHFTTGPSAPRYELRATTGGREFPLLHDPSREVVEGARRALLRAALARRPSARRPPRKRG